jgi:S1-C subfamily serine protease
VSLGVMPDYAFTGTGVRIEGTSQGKLGEKLGLKSADVLLQVGDYKLIDVTSYMQALGKFKKGDKTILIIKRGNEEIKYDIQF